MADLQFPNLGNALAAGIQMRSAGIHAQREQEELNTTRRRNALAPDVQAAIGGDSAALGRIAGVDPDYALKIGPIMEAMDAKARAKAQAGADYTYKAANAILQADPAQRPEIYRQMVEQGKAQGHDLSKLPGEYTPQMEGWLRTQRQMAIPVLEQWKAEQDRPQPMGGNASPSGAPMGGSPDREKFIQTMMPHALEISKATGLDPRLVLAQSALETGWGAAAPGNNFFGIKSHGAPGGQTLGTTEVGPNGAYQTQDSFRTYGGAGESAQDYTNFLKTNGRYGPLLAAQGLDAQIAALGKSGYASDPRYADKIRQIAQAIPLGASPGVPGPIAGPQSPLAASVPQANTAPMPGAPAGLAPSGPPPAQMPQPGPGQLAQGSGGDGSGTPVPPGAPPAPTPKDLLQYVPPGWKMMGHKGQPAYDHAGRLLVQRPDGQTTSIEIPKSAQPTFGWQDNGGSLSPVPGGPNDPETIKREAEAKRKAEGGGPFSGNAIDAQAFNIVLKGDPMSPEYAAAYAQLARPKNEFDPNTGKVVQIPPLDMRWARPPGSTGAAPSPATPPAAAGGQAPPAQTQGTQLPGGQTVTVTDIPGAQSNKPMNGEQSLAAGFSDRMLNSNKLLDAFAEQGLKPGGRVNEKLPLGIGNYRQTPEYQQFKQARDDFINAQLRKESGAAISDAEYKRADEQYFPQPGDKPEVVAQKAKNRQLAVDAMVRGAGPSYKPAGEAGASATPTKPMSPEEAAKLPAGTKFIGLDGVERTRH